LAHPPVGHHARKQVTLRSKAGEYLVAILDVRIHLHTSNDGGGGGDGEAHVRFMSTVSVVESCPNFSPSPLRRCVDAGSADQRSSEDGVQLLIETANNPCFGIDDQGKVTNWNLKAAEITGWASHEVKGRDLVKELISPDFRVQVKTMLDDAIQGRNTSSIEFPLLTKQGGRVEVLLNATPRSDANGNIMGVVGVGHDVTERKKAEAETARMASEMRVILDATNASIFSVDKQGKINEWNGKSEELLGYSGGEVMEYCIAEFVSPEWRVRVMEVLDYALQGRCTAYFEHLMLTKSGARLDMLLNAIPRRDVSGNVTGVVGICQDITDRKKAEAETARITLEARTIIDSVNVPIFLIDKEKKIDEWNRAAAELVGYTRDEVMGRYVVDFVSSEWQMPVKEVLDNALQGRSSTSFEHPLHTKAGKRFDMLLSTTCRRDVNGEIMGVVGVGSDITDRKNAQSATAQMASDMRTLLDTVNVLVFGIDTEGRVNEWNEKSVDLVGYNSDEVLGRDLVEEFISPEYRVAVKEVFNNALKGLVTSSFEVPLISKAGISIEILLNANPRRNATGNIVGVVGIGQDLTAKRRAMEIEVDLIKVNH
jgi:PAS domain S-box-containing protein